LQRARLRACRAPNASAGKTTRPAERVRKAPMRSQLHQPPHLLGVEPGRGVEPPATQAASARSSALTKTRCSPPPHSRTKTRSGSFSYRPTTSPPEPSAMPSVSQITRILSPCLKVQSSDRVDALLVDISIFIGSERLRLKAEERSVGQCAGMSPDDSKYCGCPDRRSRSSGADILAVAADRLSPHREGVTPC